MMTPTPQAFPAPETLLMHSGDMLLLDRITAFDAECTMTTYRPQAQAWYADQDGNMPAWMGIELMAQTIAAHVGLLKQQQGLPPKQGVLLGTRRYHAHVPAFAADTLLEIKVSVAFRDDSGLGAYDCVINSATGVVAEATLKVYEPEDFQSFLQGNTP